jgi:hypothetical protein
MFKIFGLKFCQHCGRLLVGRYCKHCGVNNRAVR